MSNLYCRRHQQSWPQNTEVKFGPRDEYGITRLPCCAAETIEAPGGPYDGRVGSKGGGASALAAAEISDKVGPLRMACLNYVIEFGPTGADDMAQALGQLWGNIRPRCAELTKPEHFSLFEKGPMTALTYCGKAQHVYQLSDAGRSYAQGRAA